MTTPNILLSEEFNHVMCDLETGGTSPDAYIAQIACALFGNDQLTMAFEITTGVQFAQPGRVLDSQTMAWWADPKRADAFKQVWKETSFTLLQALCQFNAHLDTIKALNDKPIMLWSKGISFDIPILVNAFKQFGMEFPVSFRNFHDYRTISDMHKALPATDALRHYGIRGEAAYHTAFADVEYQAYHLMYISKYYDRA